MAGWRVGLACIASSGSDGAADGAADGDRGSWALDMGMVPRIGRRVAALREFSQPPGRRADRRRMQPKLFDRARHLASVPASIPASAPAFGPTPDAGVWDPVAAPPSSGPTADGVRRAAYPALPPAFLADVITTILSPRRPDESHVD